VAAQRDARRAGPRRPLGDRRLGRDARHPRAGLRAGHPGRRPVGGRPAMAIGANRPVGGAAGRGAGVRGVRGGGLDVAVPRTHRHVLRDRRPDGRAHPTPGGGGGRRAARSVQRPRPGAVPCRRLGRRLHPGHTAAVELAAREEPRRRRQRRPGRRARRGEHRPRHRALVGGGGPPVRAGAGGRGRHRRGSRSSARSRRLRGQELAQLVRPGPDRVAAARGQPRARVPRDRPLAQPAIGDLEGRRLHAADGDAGRSRLRRRRRSVVVPGRATRLRRRRRGWARVARAANQPAAGDAGASARPGPQLRGVVLGQVPHGRRTHRGPRR
jgi:hypothetical protein